MNGIDALNDEDAWNDDKEVDALIGYLEELVNRSKTKIFMLWIVYCKMDVLEICGRKDTPMLETYVISLPVIFFVGVLPSDAIMLLI